MQTRMWREGDIMRQRLGISLTTDSDDYNAADSKRDRSGNIDSASRQFADLSLNSADKKYAEGASSSKPLLNSRFPSTTGKASVDTSSFPAEEDGQITQGDMLRQRRAHAHHLTPAEAKASSLSSSPTTTSSTLAQSKTKVVASATATAKPASTRPTTRSQLSKFLGK